ncbi:MAG: hypothetical protein AB7P02_21155 [Alphaproteobacteria bacterium]
MSWAHVLQIAGKAPWPGPFWATAMLSLYGEFGRVGGAVQSGSILAAWALPIAAGGRARPWAIAGAVLLSLDMAMWVACIAPLNAEMASWAPATPPPDMTGYLAYFTRVLPPDWDRVRDAWEGWHAVGAVLDALGFAALIVALWHCGTPASGGTATIAGPERGTSAVAPRRNRER